MKTRGIIGRKITAVKQTCCWNDQTGHMSNCIDYLLLDDGTRLVPTTEEFGSYYGTDFVILKPQEASNGTS